MSRKKKKSIPVVFPEKGIKQVIDMNRVNLSKVYEVPGFRTGRNMTEKDRPRKKNWKNEYYRAKESDIRGQLKSDSFFMRVSIFFPLEMIKKRKWTYEGNCHTSHNRIYFL